MRCLGQRKYKKEYVSLNLKRTDNQCSAKEKKFFKIHKCMQKKPVNLQNQEE